MNARQRQIREALRARERQVTEFEAVEAAGQCPGCRRVGEVLGAHDCGEPLTLDEAVKRMDHEGGIIRQINRHDPSGSIDGLLDDFMQETGDEPRTLRFSPSALRRVEAKLADEFGGIPIGSGSTYKGIPIVEDDRLPGEMFAVAGPKPGHVRAEGGTVIVDGKPLGTVRDLHITPDVPRAVWDMKDYEDRGFDTTSMRRQMDAYNAFLGGTKPHALLTGLTP